MLVQTLIPESGIERLDEGVFIGLAWSNKIMRDESGFDPSPESIGLEFWPIVTPEALGSNGKAGEKTGNLFSANGGIHQNAHALLGKVIDHRQALELTARHEPVVNKDHGPGLGGTRRRFAHDLGHA